MRLVGGASGMIAGERKREASKYRPPRVERFVGSTVQEPWYDGRSVTVRSLFLSPPRLPRLLRVFLEMHALRTRPAVELPPQ